MKLRLALSNGEYLYIDLVDDDWIHQWAKKITTLELDITEHVALGSICNTDHNVLFDCIDNFICVLNEELSNLGITVPDFLPTAIDLKKLDSRDIQMHLNRIHRWLVFMMFRKSYIVNNQDYIPNNINELFETQYDNMMTTLLKLNQLVHAIESNYTSPGTDTFPGNQHQHPYWDQAFKGDDVISLAADAPLERMLSTNNHDVWLAKRILGKDFRECWLDNDDPSYEDITNIGEILHYAFEVDPLNNLDDFYNSEQFASWMKQYGRDINNIGRIPIGNIIDMPDNIYEIMQCCTIEKIEII